MSEFTSSGGEVFPNTHADTQLITTFAELTDEILDRKAKEYSLFLQREDLMPRAIETAQRILEHLIFEINYREGSREQS